MAAILPGAIGLLAACSGGEVRPPSEPLGAQGQPAPVTIASPVIAAAAAPEAPWHPVFDFVDNRHLAHVRWHGAELVRGDGSFARVMDLGKRGRAAWALGQQVDGRALARLEARTQIFIPVDDALAAVAAPVLTMSVHASQRGRLTVDAGGKQGKTSFALAAGWQRLAAALPPLSPGDRQLTMAGRAAIEWLALGPALPSTEPPRAVDRHGLHLGPATAITYLVDVPASARLRGELAPGADCVPEVELWTDGETAPTRKPLSAPVTLAARAGQVVAVRLVARCEVTLANVWVERAGAAPRLRAGKPPKVIVLWIMDTLRYDRVPLWYPGAVAEVPAMERLAREGAVFTSYYPGGNESTVSHASIFSGLRPGIHRIAGGIKGFTWRFNKSWTTLGQLARAGGLSPLGVTANGHVNSGAGYGFGFVKFENPMDEGHHEPDYGYSGSKVLARVLELAAAHKDAPMMLFLGTIDTHCPWRAHEPWTSRYDAVNQQPYRGPFRRSATAGGIKVSGMLSRTPAAPRDQERLRAIYAADISYQDDLLGKLVDQLTAWGLADDTMIIVTGDHGEEFWEHGIAGHGGSLHEPVVHTPLLLWYPARVPAVRIDAGTEGIDIMATIADALGQPVPPGAQGSSLIALAQGVGSGYTAPTIASHWEQAHAVRLADWKLFVEGDGDTRFYDLATDPEERTELGQTRPLARLFVRDVTALARVHEARWMKSTWGNAANMTALAAQELD
jgi:arylsulfatase A-like enzyme